MELFEKMQLQGLLPDAISHSALFSACRSRQHLTKGFLSVRKDTQAKYYGYLFHGELNNNVFIHDDAVHINADLLIDRLSTTAIGRRKKKGLLSTRG